MWMFNSWLWILSIIYPDIAKQLISDGTQWYVCVQWDGGGHSIPDAVCLEPMPIFIEEIGGTLHSEVRSGRE